jgi:coiled-coil domain-containing protein 39
LSAELRLLRDDIHRITLELRDRELKAEKLAAKYTTISTKKQGTAVEDEPRSQAYYVIKVRAAWM